MSLVWTGIFVTPINHTMFLFPVVTESSETRAGKESANTYNKRILTVHSIIKQDEVYTFIIQ